MLNSLLDGGRDILIKHSVSALNLLVADAQLLWDELHMVKAFHKLDHSLISALAHSPHDGTDILDQLINCYLSAPHQAPTLLRIHSSQLIKMNHDSFPLFPIKIYRSSRFRSSKISRI